MYVVSVNCEWDLGANDFLYATESLARKRMEEALLLQDLGTLEELEEDGLISFEDVEVVCE